MKPTKKILSVLLFVLAFAFTVPISAQRINKISALCPSSSFLVSRVLAKADGNVYFDPCATKSNIFTGINDFSTATSVILPSGSAGVSGSGTTNFIPRWTNGAAGVLGNSPFSWDGTIYNFNNTALTCTFCLNFTPSVAGAGIFSAGVAGNIFTLTESTGISNLTTSTSINLNAPTVTTNATTITATSANLSVLDQAYSATWNGLVSVPTKNAVYDQLQIIAPWNKEYTATVTQAAAGAPVPTIQNNTTGTTVTFARAGAGSYTATAGVATWTANKTVIMGAVAATCGLNFVRTSTTVITITTFDTTIGAGTDSCLTESAFHVLVYP